MISKLARTCAVLVFSVLDLIPYASFAAGRHMIVKATAFNSTRAQTDDRPNEAACGDHIEPGMKVLAVSRDLFKAGLDCGTEVRIKGLAGTWTIVDQTAPRFRKRVDIYMGRDVEAAREWGVQDVEIRW